MQDRVNNPQFYNLKPAANHSKFSKFLSKQIEQIIIPIIRFNYECV